MCHNLFFIENLLSHTFGIILVVGFVTTCIFFHNVFAMSKWAISPKTFKTFFCLSYLTRDIWNGF